MLFLPEQKIKFLLDFLLEQIDEDYLFRLFGGQVFGDGYNYFENAKALLLKSEDSPRKIQSNIFFNKDRQGLPTIHIALNQDIPGEGNGLGFDPSEEIVEGGHYDCTSRMYSSRFNIICTSDNTFEVLIMYNVIRALFQSNPELLEWSGLSNPKFSGQDLILTDYLMPPNIYARGFIIDCIYQFDTPGLKLQEDIKQIYFQSLCCGFDVENRIE